MASQAALRDAEWDVADLHWETGPPSPGERGCTVRCVFRRVAGGWEPWVVEAESALMRRVGRRGLGLYAARAFKRDDFLGRYDGQVVGTFASRDEALASAQCASRVRHGADKLITRRPSHGPGVELVDGATSGPPFMPRMNDPTRGTRLQPNVEVTPGGWVKVTQRRIPAFDLAADLEGNVSAELRLSYGGQEYWDLIARIGGSAEYALEVD